MSKRNLVFLLFAFLFLSGQALGQPPGEVVFVSTFNGHKILEVDVSTGTSTVIFTGDSSFLPEDIVVGPDGKIYVCDSLSDKIWRMNQDGSEVEIIYDVDIAGGPTGPEGPSFLNNTLVFNTRGPSLPNFPDVAHTGLWKIADVATFPFGNVSPPSVNLSIPAPQNLIGTAGTGSTFGEGTDFDEIGNLLFVDSSNDKIWRISPPDFDSTTLTLLIDNPGSALFATPIGLAVNSKNDIFVADFGTGNVQRFGSDGIFLGTFTSFFSLLTPDHPVFMEFDASDNLFVATAQSGTAAIGKVWKVDTLGNKTLVTPTPLDFAAGLAVPPTSTFITKSFSSVITSQNFNFGTHSFSITFDAVFSSFALTVTAEDVLPAGVVLLGGGVPPVQYAYKGGFAVVYGVSGSPTPAVLPEPGIDYADTDPDGGILIYIGYFTAGIDAGISGRTRNFSRFIVGDTVPPTLLHDPSGDASDDFSEDVTVEFFPEGVPEESSFIGFLKPIKPDGSSVFKAKKVVPLKFILIDDMGNPIPDALAVITKIERTSDDSTGGLEEPASPGEANTDNIFRYDDFDEQYIYNLSTKGFLAGSYVVTVTSDKFLPRKARFKLR